jgi:hypothetical protein
MELAAMPQPAGKHRKTHQKDEDELKCLVLLKTGSVLHCIQQLFKGKNTATL